MRRTIIALAAFVAASVSLLGFDAPALQSQAPSLQPARIVAMRRLTEEQYRNSIADIFGTTINVRGRFEPILRPQHDLIAIGASDAAISPAGLEQFDGMARGIAEQVFDEARRMQFMPCQPADAKQPDAGCADKVLVPWGRYLFRRPLTVEERQRYLTIASEAAVATGSFYAGMELSLAAMLVSPNFLYVVERAYPDPANPDVLHLDDYARASRLSFFLWNSAPNNMLLEAAEKAQLRDQKQLEKLAGQMAASPRLGDGVRAFFADMLNYENFENISKDPVIFPRYNQDMGRLLPEQMLQTIVGFLVEEQGSYKDLFTTRRTAITRTLGTIYRLPVSPSKTWEMISLPADSPRVGLAGQPAFLALYAQSGRSSPTLRGRAIRELLLCQRVPDPPGNVDQKIVQETANPVYRTARTRLQAHNDNPVCKGCHLLTDPIGLALENFDGIGSFRTQENGETINASANLGDKDFVGAAGLGKILSDDPATTNCVVTRALEYAGGKRLASEEVAADVEKMFAAQRYRIRALFQRVATEPSLYRVQLSSRQASSARSN